MAWLSRMLAMGRETDIVRHTPQIVLQRWLAYPQKKNLISQA